MENNVRQGKLPVKVKVGYGIGTVADSIPYTLFFSYFIYYLTDFVGMAPSRAGIISFVSVLWCAIAGPIVCYISDNSKNPNGRRRPYLLRVIFPFVFIIILSFAPFHFTGNGAFVYYIIIGMLFQTCYACWKGPWDALGAELTDDYTERNNVRLFIGICAYPALVVASSGTILMVGMFPDSPRLGWFVGATICAVVVMIGCLICWRNTKGYEYFDTAQVEAQQEMSEKVGPIEMIKLYCKILKGKAYRRLTIMQFIFTLGYIVLTNGVIYCLTYNAGLSEGIMSIFFVLNAIISLVLTPVIVGFANKFDKKFSMFVFEGITVVGFIVFYIIGINGFVSAFIFAVCTGFATTVFYGVMYSLIYDCCDIHELATGERTEGSIMAISALSQTVASAVGGLIFGMLLTAIGYDAANITPEVIHGILTLVTLVPAAAMVISLLVLCLYKVNPKRFQDVQEALKERREGKEIDLKEFKDII